MTKKLSCPKPDATRHHAVLLTLETFLAVTDTPAPQRQRQRQRHSEQRLGGVNAPVSKRAVYTAAPAHRG